MQRKQMSDLGLLRPDREVEVERKGTCCIAEIICTAKILYLQVLEYGDVGQVGQGPKSTEIE